MDLSIISIRHSTPKSARKKCQTRLNINFSESSESDNGLYCGLGTAEIHDLHDANINVIDESFHTEIGYEIKLSNTDTYTRFLSLAKHSFNECPYMDKPETACLSSAVASTNSFYTDVYEKFRPTQSHIAQADHTPAKMIANTECYHTEPVPAAAESPRVQQNVGEDLHISLNKQNSAKKKSFRKKGRQSFHEKILKKNHVNSIEPTVSAGGNTFVNIVSTEENPVTQNIHENQKTHESASTSNISNTQEVEKWKKKNIIKRLKKFGRLFYNKSNKSNLKVLAVL